MLTIKKIFAQQTLTNKAEKAVECVLELSSGSTIKTTTTKKLSAEDIETIIKEIQETVAPRLQNQPLEVLKLDAILMDLHSQISCFNKQTTLTVSMALFQAQAHAEKIELFKLIQSVCATTQISIPKPLLSLITLTNQKGGFQQILSSPEGKNFHDKLHYAIELFQNMSLLLGIEAQQPVISQFGSFLLNNYTVEQALNLTRKAQAAAAEHVYQIGISMDADSYIDQTTQNYVIENQIINPVSIVNHYKTVFEQYEEISYIQDPFAQNESKNWQELVALYPSLAIAADNMLKTNPLKIRWAIKNKACSVVVIKPTNMNTISQTLAAIEACRYHKMNFTICADDWGINDTFVSDIAVATNAAYFQAGAAYGAEHIAKYNRLIEIERQLA